MKSWTLTLLAAFATSALGCAAGVAPQGSAAPSRGPAATIRTASAPVSVKSHADEDGRLGNSMEAMPAPSLGASLAASPTTVKPTCLAETSRGFAGFYATDAWTPGEVVLTFDDGPHPKGTPRVLDLLAQHHMPATFFVVGRAINRDTYPLVQRIVAEGHTLGSHSYSHDVHMTRVEAPTVAHEDILGQHQVTTILIDLALAATSGDDFDAMFRQVFQLDPAKWLTSSQIRKGYATFAGRHAELLAARGFEAGARPYDVLYSRPPGGGPYVEHDGAAGMAIHDGALADLSMLNVMWHGASGDTDPAQRGDFAFLTSNIERAARSGGVLLIHDYIRPDALAHGLAKIAANPDVHVVAMEGAVKHKFGCDSRALGATLRAERASEGRPGAPLLTQAAGRPR